MPPDGLTSGPGGTQRPGARTISPRRWIEHLIAQLPVARAGVDPEGVHQVRVATARLRVWLRLGRRRVLNDDLKWLRDHAASVRDLDVHLSRELPSSVELHLRTQRSGARGELLRALDHARVRGLLDALSLLPPLSRREAVPRVARLARAALRRGRYVVAHPRRLPGLHALRRAVRRLRFALEWLGACPDPVIDLQDVLGTVGDCMVALAHLDLIPRGTRDGHAYRRRLERELARHVREARHEWHRARRTLEEVARWKSS